MRAGAAGCREGEREIECPTGSSRRPVQGALGGGGRGRMGACRGWMRAQGLLDVGGGAGKVCRRRRTSRRWGGARACKELGAGAVRGKKQA